MSRRADRFAMHFAVLFLCVLLAMFGLFLFMRAYDGREVGDRVWNFSEAFRVNLFLIDLSVLLVIESLLIFLFVRYTVPALIISSGGIVALVAAGQRLLEQKSIALFFSPFVHNEYTYLRLGDGVLLFLLNAVLLAFLVAMMHHYHQLELAQQAARQSAADPPAPPEEQRE